MDNTKPTESVDLDRLEQLARENWNAQADPYNQWDNLGNDERDALIARARRAPAQQEADDLRTVAQAILARWDEHAPADELSDEHKALRAALTQPAGQRAVGECDAPPPGWYCTRTPGHSGPCAAHAAPQGIQNEEEHARAVDQGAAQDEAHDAGRVGGSGRDGANQHHEHRTGQPSADGRNGGEDGRGAGVSNRGEVRATVATPPSAGQAAAGPVDGTSKLLSNALEAIQVAAHAGAVAVGKDDIRAVGCFEDIAQRIPGLLAVIAAPTVAAAGPVATWQERTKADKWQQPATTYMEAEITELRAKLAAASGDAGALEMACVVNRKLGDALAGRSYLLPDDLAALKRFHQCATDFDAGGHDVSKDVMARLREIGVVQSLGFGRYQTTAFGDYVLERNFGEPAKLPLKTLAERNEDARAAMASPVGAGDQGGAA